MTPRRLALAAGLLAALAPGVRLGAQATPPAAPINFSSYFSIGDSLAAGYLNQSLVETHQVNSVPALIARQAGVADFQQPLVSEPGIPPEFALVRSSPSLLIAPKASAPGVPKNAGLARAYNNLAVPGATAADALSGGSNAGGFHEIVLRGRGSQVEQAVASRPTFVTVWIGHYDVLPAVIQGRALEGRTVTPAAAFRTAFQEVIAALRATGARIVAANLPDVTALPFVTTIPRVAVNPATGQPLVVGGQQVPLMGPEGPLPPGTFVTLAASALLARGDGVPTAAGGRGTPLPDEAILDADEISFIKDRVNAYNQAIAEICQAAGIPVVDMNAYYRQMQERGYNLGGVVLSSAFLTGGLFGYDGVHPSELGYALAANEWIRVINLSGGQLAPVDLGRFLGTTAAQP